MPITNEQAASLATHVCKSGGFTPEERACLDSMTDAEIDQAARIDPDAAIASPSALKPQLPSGIIGLAPGGSSLDRIIAG